LSPSFLSQRARLPFSMVGDSAGMRMLVGMFVSTLEPRLPLHAGSDRDNNLCGAFRYRSPLLHLKDYDDLAYLCGD
jgi:hypothetical protein